MGIWQTWLSRNVPRNKNFKKAKLFLTTIVQPQKQRVLVLNHHGTILNSYLCFHSPPFSMSLSHVTVSLNEQLINFINFNNLLYSAKIKSFVQSITEENPSDKNSQFIIGSTSIIDKFQGSMKVQNNKKCIDLIDKQVVNSFMTYG